jgi:hypothetical protein
MTALWLLAISCGDSNDDDSNAPCTDTFFSDADEDGHGDAQRSTTACAVPSGYTTTSDDCDDTDPAIHPGADEQCNALDDDCDEAIDEDAPGGTSFYVDADLDGFGTGPAVLSCAAPSGYTAIAGDCADDDPDVNPDAFEMCNGIDDDCNGAIDSLDPGLDDGSVYYADADADGYGDPATGTRACEKAADRTLDDSDCNDRAATAHPGGIEVCGTGIDEDCDLAVDNCVLSSADADVFVQGPEASFGMTIGVLDLNVDGVSDLVLSSWFQTNQAGVVYIAYGPVTAGTTTDDMTTLSSDVEDGYFGWKVSGGDANADGVDDLLVSASLWNTLADVYLFLGPVTSDGERGDADAVLDGDTDTTGADIDLVSDFDGDAAADFVVGAPDANPSGAVYVVSGPVSGRVHLPDATYTFQGLGRDDALGTASTRMGDTNGDGIDDLAIGAPYDGNGAVYVVEGGESSGTYAIDTVASSSLSGPDFESAFGSALASADYDGDGTADLFVSAIWAEAPGNADGGAVYAFLGPFADELDTGDAVATWSPIVDSEVFGFGYDIATGDADADGQVDVLMGLPYTGGVTTDGLAYLQLGSASGAIATTSLATIQGRSREGLGTGVAFVPDWTGDGGAELALGGPEYRDASEENFGALYLFASERFHP